MALPDMSPASTATAVGLARVRHRRPRRGGFTLIELIFVMLLLLVIASLVAPRMSSFFRGRALSGEARRMLSVMHYAQTRAVAEGVPVIFWIDPAQASYGLEVGVGHASAEDRQRVYVAEPSLQLEVLAATDAPESETGEERLGLTSGKPGLRFNPDGFFEDGGVSRILIRQGDEAALQLVPTPNRLGFEILPLGHAN